jgi:hypothetical protein
VTSIVGAVVKRAAVSSLGKMARRRVSTSVSSGSADVRKHTLVTDARSTLQTADNNAIRATAPGGHDPAPTPGAVLTTDAAAVCQPGYAKTVRHPRRMPKLLAMGARPLQARLDSLLDH